MLDASVLGEVVHPRTFNALRRVQEGDVTILDEEEQRALDEARTPAERAEREKTDFLRHTDSAGRVVDFHELRVRYVSRVVEAGANVKEAMELARHSDPKLTLKTYARVGIHSLARVLDGLPAANLRPSPDREEMRATGTDNHTANADLECPQKSPQSEHGAPHPSAASRAGDTTSGSGPSGSKTLKLAGLGAAAQRGAAQLPVPH